MSDLNQISVQQVMRQEATEVDGSINVMEAMRIMKRVGATCLIVKKRDGDLPDCQKT